MSNPKKEPKYLTPIQTSLHKWSSDIAMSFLTTSFIGAVWGCFNPIPLPGSHQAIQIAKTGKFVPLPPFSSPSSVGYFAALFGSISIVHRVAAGGLGLARGGKEDVWNNLAGFAAVGGYWAKVLSVERRVIWNNRLVGGLVLGSVVYANIAP
mmetsp:Transcript_2409/g.5218  ORF Transcript_2409/g.5218 Transcript_2409/m.5218 type:complete len:152 (+) Transcript_2409:18-473(+)|eukprot:CAMPEP_0171367510 /NCGR_PEP_ID=MMETSP0879-20121228/6127_1 /TAXON_ID=67004 /ORGANISM="Thalassiosira weissflogii, Strain CCMP1336" /LENGTH=151 /DNA_ID=CAMNT_0011875559 /DNA_START=13 /DNA_END=468 /DNA_ORIENTATION=-